MSKAKSSSFSWVKNYFKDHFPQVQKVEVRAQKSGPHEVVALVRVKVGKRWFVIKKKGKDMAQVLKKAKEGMSVKIRQEMGKIKGFRYSKLSRVQEFY